MVYMLICDPRLCRRAAHFAYFDADEEGDISAVHAGGDDIRRLGPINSTYELAEGIEVARAVREEKLRASRAQAVEAATWHPSRDVGLGPRHSSLVPTLEDLALGVVVDFIEDVESIDGLPDAIRVRSETGEVILNRIASEVCKKRRMTPAAFRLFAGDSPSELCVADCTRLDTYDLETVLKDSLGPGLEVLDLGLCGRGLTSDLARCIAGWGPFPKLHAIRLGGAYGLGDEALLALVRAAPNLRSLRLPQASRLETLAVAELPALAPKLRELDLSDARGIPSASLNALLCSLPALERLSLCGLPEVSDQLLAACLPSLPLLRTLRLDYCAALTDATAQTLARSCPRLSELSLAHCTLLTDAGLAALTPLAPNLEVLSLGGCSKLSETALAPLLARCGSLRELVVAGVHGMGPGAVRALRGGEMRSGLEHLDLSWCRRVSDDALGELVEAARGLRVLQLWGCTQIGERFLYGHGNENVVVRGRGEPLVAV
ncbi:hypothetical protein H632_c1199p0 [Helicosporidium sp. ATCC 50920]|nr:hypothetical protein H632_c1199p0 [Helicosporidium sp. ATCC 50920]|eukprot:KDD74595.1 hypothetical protein H632_c1199p0 [Helicosporidium sp. ATCC 50920]